MTTTYYPTRDGALLLPAPAVNEAATAALSKRLPAGWYAQVDETGDLRANLGTADRDVYDLAHVWRDEAGAAGDDEMVALCERVIRSEHTHEDAHNLLAAERMAAAARTQAPGWPEASPRR